MVHRLSCSVAYGIFPDLGLNAFACTGRQILIHCTTREVLKQHLDVGFHGTSPDALIVAYVENRLPEYQDLPACCHCLLCPFITLVSLMNLK